MDIYNAKITSLSPYDISNIKSIGKVDEVCSTASAKPTGEYYFVITMKGGSYLNMIYESSWKAEVQRAKAIEWFKNK